jgi:hypothetical protein
MQKVGLMVGVLVIFAFRGGVRKFVKILCRRLGISGKIFIQSGQPVA